MTSRPQRAFSPRTSPLGRTGLALLILGAAAATSLRAQGQLSPDGVGRARPIAVRIDQIERFRVTSLGEVLEDTGGIAGPCPPTVATHTDASFGGGSFVAQAGFSQQEAAAASYVLPAAAFPIRIDLAEMIFATSAATQQTVTQWTILFWDGNPQTGQLIASYSSDDVILPHLRVGPGTAGANIQFSIDPQDPEQVYINNVSGTNTFSVGYRIDVHNQQTQNPCLVAPPSCCNAFPCTDVSGLSQPSRNWLLGLNCGPFGCPANGGWASFATLPGFCRPSGDWVLRATWTSVNCVPPSGACCFAATGACQVLTAAECGSAGGTYQGDSTTCATANCPQPTGACCFVSTGGCINLSSANCAGAGGQFRGTGTACGTTICFPIGACCLPNGACLPAVSPETCASNSGNFQGHNTSCANIDCPDPVGACCFGTFCLVLSAVDCGSGGGAWHGLGTNCADGNQNGTADSCEAPTCAGDRGDANCNGSVDFFDIDPFLLAIFNEQSYLSTYCNASLCAADADCSGSVDFFDIDPFLQCLFSGCANCP